MASFSVTFRAVSLTRAANQPEANKTLAYDVVAEIRNSPLFDPDPEATSFQAILPMKFHQEPSPLV